MFMGAIAIDKMDSDEMVSYWSFLCIEMVVECCVASRPLMYITIPTQATRL